MSQNKLIKPFLKWAGGKRQLADEISKWFPSKIGTYYEPFLGGGAILFKLQPKKACIGDRNEQLILTYQVIRDNVDELIEILENYTKQNSADFYYKIREQDRDKCSFEKRLPVEKAARMIYLNKTCYNGLYRVNSQGLFNTPYGSNKNPAICEKAVLRAVSNYLNDNQIEIICDDFEFTVKSAKKGDFVYFDPPYDSPNSTNFTGYQAGGFDQKEQIRLRDFVVGLTEDSIKCLLSNSATDFIKNIYGGEHTDIFTIECVDARRAICSNAEGRGCVQEVVIRNWKDAPRSHNKMRQNLE